MKGEAATNPYVTGTMIRRLREEKKLTQIELAQKICVTDKAVSRWETGKGYPDITLLAPLAAALGVSVSELLAGSSVRNENRSFAMLRSHLYVCPVCGNVITAVGDANITCCGVTLLPLTAEMEDELHPIRIAISEDEYYVAIDHEMTKEHYISFIAAQSDNGMQIIKLYPEGKAEARFKISRVQRLLYYCNRHGLYRVRVRGSAKD